MNCCFRAWKKARVPIIYTTGYVFKSEAESGAWLYRFPEEQRHRVAAMDSPDLHEIVEDIAPGENDLVILKEKPSAFFGTQLQSILNHHKTLRAACARRRSTRSH
jgi:isochorismate hydrolase